MKMPMPTHNNSYKKLLIMAVLSFISMYVLMYAMVNAFENVIPNINQFYMAGLMTTPMIIIELISITRLTKEAGVKLLFRMAKLKRIIPRISENDDS